MRFLGLKTHHLSHDLAIRKALQDLLAAEPYHRHFTLAKCVINVLLPPSPHSH